MAVVGASLAGLSAARSLRRRGYDGRLVVIGAEPHRPYDRSPLSKGFLAGTTEAAGLALEADGEELAAEWLLGTAAVGLDRRDRAVRLADGRRIRADKVVIATGAEPRTLPSPEPLAGVHVLRTLDDAVTLRQAMRRGGRLVVIGGGLIGLEVAATARALGLTVTVVEAAPAPLAGPLGPRMGSVVAALHADHGVRLLCGAGVRAVRGASRVEAVVLDDGRLLPADTVVVGIGARPCVQWLAGSGVALRGGVCCDAAGRTSVPDVVAVGDCAAWYDPATGRRRRDEYWSCARERSAVAVAALLPSGPPPPRRPPYFWSDQYGVRIRFAGDVAGADGVSVVEGDTGSRSFVAVYRRGERPVAVLAMDRARSFTRFCAELTADPAARTPEPAGSGA
ncbi:ferredoxin reductase [Streptantibioticus cattleyicolor NRRL 8057 = DSM 46488]|uniref:Ferredoxin reductase n=1 Tax=Streptantibioticus cattleyicolor (strain ATCC 35852 / DSM 46488 / JCM 4925 / NBRC 14057 / NRRL 8057) TaxID=1003195 RepID=G8WTF8_STREN|nr:ferredoxin reductase [Streptantibioticus cattleyicolor NRRL 8057 = DSM 46488]